MTMYIRMLSVFLVWLAAFTSCSDKTLLESGEGTLMLKIRVQDDLPVVVSRGTLTDDELLKKCKVYLRNKEGLIRKYTSYDEVPKQLQLVADQYKVEVMAGDSVAASFTDSYYKGTSDFTLTAGQSLSQSVVCKIMNLVTAVEVEEELAEAVPKYTITLSISGGELEYTPKNIATTGYFIFPGDDTQLAWSFEGKMSDGTAISKRGIIDQAKKKTKYLLTFSNSAAEVGGGMIKVDVESKDLDIPDANFEVELDGRPIIKSLSVDGDNQEWQEINEPIYRSQKSFDPVIVLGMAANTPLTSVLIYSSSFHTLNSEFPVTSVGYNFLNMEPAEVENMRRLGLEFNIKSERTSATITFSEELRRKITDASGTYKFDVTVEDTKGKLRIKTLSIVVSNLCVATEEVDEGDVWSKRVTLRGRILDQENVRNHRFRYKKTSESSWIEIPSTDMITNGTEYSYVLDGLLSNTEYEYQAIDDVSDVTSLITYSFKTEEERKLENPGFEDWHKSDKTIYVYQNGGTMFWDSGNKGATTGIAAAAGDNVTTNDNTIKHSGEYSAKLRSNYFGLLGIGAFAAGNIFVGKYLKTDGTDGVLRFGRPWTSRPTALKLWYKYISCEINYSTHSDAPMKSMDKGHIYIALGDWKHVEAEGEKDIPVLVKTKSQELFDSNSYNVIAYGEKVITTSTSEDGLVEITIPITYRSDRKPTDIIVVGSASKYGDYFTGGTGSTLWLDDLELIYDK